MAQVNSQIAVLNRDYRAKNTDRTKVPQVWKGFVADAFVEFELASNDPEGGTTNGITFTKTAYDAAFEADVLVVITEWHEFRGLDPRRIKQVMRQPRIVDLRNIFNPDEMRGLGFTYEGVGRPGPSA